MPNARIHNQAANARIGYSAPNARVSSFQSGISEPAFLTSIMPGMPIGLLLALTYATDMSFVTPPVYFGDVRPNVRITST